MLKLKKFLSCLTGLLLFASISTNPVMAAPNRESGHSDAPPIVLYGKTSAGALKPLLTNSDGSLQTSGRYATGNTYLDSDVTAVGNVGVGEDNLITYTLPASTLATNGDWVEIDAWGTYAANANNKTIKAYFGSTTIYTTGVVAANSGSWHLRAIVARTAAATQEASAYFVTSNATATDDATHTTPAETLSGTVTIKLTGEATSNNDIVHEGMVITKGTSVGSTGVNAVTFVGCTDSIDTAITNANSGDTLVLGSCTYSISAALAVNKSLTIKGLGPKTTYIDTGTNQINAFTVTASDVTIQDLSVIGTNIAIAINFNGEGITTLSNNWARNVHVIIGTDATAADGILFEDSGGGVENALIQIDYTSSGSGQSRGTACWINQAAAGDAESDVTCIFKDVKVTMIDHGTGTGNARAFMFWQSSANVGQYSVYGYLSNCQGFMTPFDTGNVVEAINVQGPNAAYNPGITGKVEVWLANSYFDGAYKKEGVEPVTTNWRNMRLDDYSISHLQNVATNPKAHITTTNSPTIYRESQLHAYGMISALPDQKAQHLDANDVFELYGQQGGNKPGTGAQTGLTGADATITLGEGGSATAATTTGTGGRGGNFVLTAGAGGDETIATTTTNTAGAGGYFEFIGGAGGDASNAATTNNGGAGGSLFLVGGAGGTGASNNGVTGDVVIPSTQSGTVRGYLRLAGTSAGAPAAGDCDANAERGRMTIDTSNNRLYVCNGATRLWDYIALTD